MPERDSFISVFTSALALIRYNRKLFLLIICFEVMFLLLLLIVAGLYADKIASSAIQYSQIVITGQSSGITAVQQAEAAPYASQLIISALTAIVIVLVISTIFQSFLWILTMKLCRQNFINFTKLAKFTWLRGPISLKLSQATLMLFTIVSIMIVINAAHSAITTQLGYIPVALMGALALTLLTALYSAHICLLIAAFKQGHFSKNFRNALGKFWIVPLIALGVSAMTALFSAPFYFLSQPAGIMASVLLLGIGRAVARIVLIA